MRTALVVDDNLDIHKLLFIFLMKHFYVKIKFAQSGSDALAVVLSQKVDLIISDVEMKNGDGIWLSSEVKKLIEPPRLIFFTSIPEKMRYLKLDTQFETIPKSQLSRLLTVLTEDGLLKRKHLDKKD